MPRKAFVADLSEVVSVFDRNNVKNLRGGDEDGQIKFFYQQSHAGGGTEVTVLVPGRSSLISTIFMDIPAFFAQFPRRWTSNLLTDECRCWRLS